MLFDLRSRGRRRTVQVVYLGLALILGGGLVLFGVGTGQSGGGLLNAIGGNGGGGGSAAVSQEETAALKQIKKNPNDPQAWGNLLQARWSTAINEVGSSGAFTTAGRNELGRAIQAWNRYVQLASTPDATLATLAARAYVALGNYVGAASAWETEAAGSPTEPKGYECLAANAYAAGETRKGDLAAAKAVKLTPKIQQITTKLALSQAKRSSTAARNLAAQC